MSRGSGTDRPIFSEHDIAGMQMVEAMPAEESFPLDEREPVNSDEGPLTPCDQERFDTDSPAYR
ncbi:hypothetical protein [Alicyclobacillus dauci]|uniref:Uncharacterized protein n=1 Tax=Alicyclobacillus dauci TaxID=1475485 RepID=A0ABY6Z6Z7_9BACL|nr:hypothetical protein [Alicyclobacillus dauci]WAH38678.1 hypothetical protein NZD86_09440 [Alicyclobacillus dauci]